MSNLATFGRACNGFVDERLGRRLHILGFTGHGACTGELMIDGLCMVFGIDCYIRERLVAISMILGTFQPCVAIIAVAFPSKRQFSLGGKQAAQARRRRHPGPAVDRSIHTSHHALICIRSSIFQELDNQHPNLPGLCALTMSSIRTIIRPAQAAKSFQRRTMSTKPSFSGVPMGSPDPINILKKKCDLDPDPGKVDLGVGVLRDEAGRTFGFDVMRKVV